MFPNPSESRASSLALNPTIEDIHDRSENEKDTPNKTSMKNMLYEPGTCKVYVSFFCEFMHTDTFMHFLTHGHIICTRTWHTCKQK